MSDNDKAFFVICFTNRSNWNIFIMFYLFSMAFSRKIYLVNFLGDFFLTVDLEYVRIKLIYNQKIT